MKKEVLIAIIIGFGLGLVITFGIWTAKKTLTQSAPESLSPTQKETITPAPTKPEFSLIIIQPEDNSIISEEKVEVKGTTIPKAIVVILYQEGEKILEADSEGNFSSEIMLTDGANEIKINAYDPEGNAVEKILTVVYSTAKI